MIGCMRPIALAAILLATACAGLEPTTSSLACPEGFRPGVLAEAYFGRAVAGRANVSDAEWAVFAASELTRRFPGGFSVSEVAGQWRGADGLIVRESTKRVSLVLTEPDRQRPDLNEAAEAFRTRFAQDSVLLTETPVCVRF